MNTVLNHLPGQLVTVIFETLAPNGKRSDGNTPPIVTRIIFPNFKNAAGFPKNMTKIDSGLYFHTFQLPKGAQAAGSYIVDITYTEPETGFEKQTFTQVVVTLPNGGYTITAG